MRAGEADPASLNQVGLASRLDCFRGEALVPTAALDSVATDEDQVGDAAKGAFRFAPRERACADPQSAYSEIVRCSSVSDDRPYARIQGETSSAGLLGYTLIVARPRDVPRLHG